MLKHLIVGSTVTQIHTVVLCKKSRICTENALSDFVIVRGNVLKTQMKKNKQTEKTGKQKQTWIENNGTKEMRKCNLSLPRQIAQCSICYEAWPQ